MSPVGISLLMLLGMAGFVWLAWRKLAIVRALAPVERWDQPAQRLRSVLVNGCSRSAWCSASGGRGSCMR